MVRQILTAHPELPAREATRIDEFLDAGEYGVACESLLALRYSGTLRINAAEWALVDEVADFVR